MNDPDGRIVEDDGAHGPVEGECRGSDYAVMEQQAHEGEAEGALDLEAQRDLRAWD
jgi:hypothetical protein